MAVGLEDGHHPGPAAGPAGPVSGEDTAGPFPTAGGVRVSPDATRANAVLRKMPIFYDYLHNINRLLINFLATHWLYPP